jgi:hypothetical protein
MIRPSAIATTCWYADTGHRPRIGWCPAACSGQASHAERVGGGEQRTYCDTHAAWRRSTSRVPTMVWRLA